MTGQVVASCVRKSRRRRVPIRGSQLYTAAAQKPSDKETYGRAAINPVS